MNESSEIKGRIMRAINEKKVHMRPRWQFVLQSVLMASGTLIALLSLVYTVSLAFFILRGTGVWFVPIFGVRGWFLFMRAIPTFIVGLAVIFLIALYVLVRRYAFVYRTPFIAALGGIIIVVSLAGFLLERTTLHHRLANAGDHGRLPPPIGFWYTHLFRPKPPQGTFRGLFVATTSNGFIMMDPDEGTTSVVMSRSTRLPFGMGFDPGARLVVIGDKTASGTIQAYGVIEVPDEDVK